MVRKKIFVVLGADMAGKTTLINKSLRAVKDYGIKVSTKYTHFSAPPPGSNPVDMYIDALDEFREDPAEYWYLDRAWPESKFYEMHRRQRDIPFEDMMRVEQEFVKFADDNNYDISINLMWKPWDFVEQFHVHELENNKEFVAHSALANNESTDLLDRKVEHATYYKFMDSYFKQRGNEYADLAKNFPFNMLFLTDLGFKLI